MFNLRAAVNAAITTLNQTYVTDKVFDYHSSRLALENLHQTPFNVAAVLLGDWESKPERFVTGWNRVVNRFELIVCAKSQEAKAALDDIVREIALALNRNRFSQDDCLDTLVVEQNPSDKAEKSGIIYWPIVIEVIAFEAAPHLTITPQVSITSPVDGGSVSVPGTLDFTVTYAKSYDPIARIDFVMYESVTMRKGLFATTTAPTIGAHVFTFDNVTLDEIPAGYYTVVVNVIDNYGRSKRTSIEIGVNII